jgi:hypothetical protein
MDDQDEEEDDDDYYDDEEEQDEQDEDADVVNDQTGINSAQAADLSPEEQAQADIAAFFQSGPKVQRRGPTRIEYDEEDDEDYVDGVEDTDNGATEDNVLTTAAAVTLAATDPVDGRAEMRFVVFVFCLFLCFVCVREREIVCVCV